MIQYIHKNKWKKMFTDLHNTSVKNVHREYNVGTKWVVSVEPQLNPSGTATITTTTTTSKKKKKKKRKKTDD